MPWKLLNVCVGDKDYWLFRTYVLINPANHILKKMFSPNFIIKFTQYRSFDTCFTLARSSSDVTWLWLFLSGELSISTDTNWIYCMFSVSCIYSVRPDSAKNKVIKQKSTSGKKTIILSCWNMTLISPLCSPCKHTVDSSHNTAISSGDKSSCVNNVSSCRYSCCRD